jgi:hypothetical protein
LLALLVSAGCVPEAAYHAYEAGGDSFALNDKYLRVNPQDYPVFAVKVDHSAPRHNVNSATGFKGGQEPELLRNYQWQVTHAFDGKYLIYSEEFDRHSCLINPDVRRDQSEQQVQEACNIHLEEKIFSRRGKGAYYRVHIYLKSDGTAYGWQYLKNPKRLILESDKVSWFRIEDSGDWSGQPWFECVERCDKLVNMQEQPSGSPPANTK